MSSPRWSGVSEATREFDRLRKRWERADALCVIIGPIPKEAFNSSTKNRNATYGLDPSKSSSRLPSLWPAFYHYFLPPCCLSSPSLSVANVRLRTRERSKLAGGSRRASNTRVESRAQRLRNEQLAIEQHRQSFTVSRFSRLISIVSQSVVRNARPGRWLRTSNFSFSLFLSLSLSLFFSFSLSRAIFFLSRSLALASDRESAVQCCTGLKSPLVLR